MMPIPPLRRLCGAVLALLILGVLLLLGGWQVQRLAWKQDLIARQATALAAPPASLADILAQPTAEQLFRPVTVTGFFPDVPPFVVGMRPRDGQPGYHLVAPFVLGDGPLAGHSILINLGWIAADRARQWRLPLGMAGGMAGRSLTLDALARLPETPTWLTPRNRPDRGEWYAVDPRTMLAPRLVNGPDKTMPGSEQGTDASQPILSLFLQLRTPVAGQGWPAPLPGHRIFRNDHRQYAVFWFVMAGVWCVIVTVIIVRRQRA